ncbi:unnamed protein product [Diamesa serratosioi]
MVSIRHMSREANGFGFGHFCGGVLISRSHVLTLGSCIDRTTNDGSQITWRPDQLRLVIGSRYRYDAESSLVLLVKEIRIHPDYSWIELRNNIALIFLQSSIGLDITTIHPVSISDTTISFGSKCDIMGWGTVFSGDGSRELRTGRVNVVHINVCNNVPNRICAGPDHVRGCPGDDGGPFVCNNVVYGLIDFKNGNHCEKDIPGRYEYYINVADYYQWITKQMKVDSLSPKNSGNGVIAIDEWFNEPVKPFIANGTISEYVPYMVSIRHRINEIDGFGLGHICGGVLITRSHILTLGSCINRTTNDGSQISWRPDQLRLVLGSRFLFEPVGSFIPVASQIRIHPSYGWDGLYNNVALIILQSPIPTELTAVINPISISATTIPIGSSCDIMGWGTVTRGNSSGELMTGRVNVVNITLCNNYPNRICAGPDNIHGCSRDDGGPFVCNNVLHGLIDFNNNNHCEQDNTGIYGYYIRIADYYTWIMEVIEASTTTTTTPKDDDNGAVQHVTSLLLLTFTVILLFIAN